VLRISDGSGSLANQFVQDVCVSVHFYCLAVQVCSPCLCSWKHACLFDSQVITAQAQAAADMDLHLQLGLTSQTPLETCCSIWWLSCHGGLYACMRDICVPFMHDSRVSRRDTDPTSIVHQHGLHALMHACMFTRSLCKSCHVCMLMMCSMMHHMLHLQPFSAGSKLLCSACLMYLLLDWLLFSLVTSVWIKQDQYVGMVTNNDDKDTIHMGMVTEAAAEWDNLTLCARYAGRQVSIETVPRTSCICSTLGTHFGSKHSQDIRLKNMSVTLFLYRSSSSYIHCSGHLNMPCCIRDTHQLFLHHATHHACHVQCASTAPR